MLTPEQCRAARAILEWSRETLAEKAGVSAGTVYAYEKGDGTNVLVGTVQKLRKALASAGLDFIEDGEPSETGGPGLRLRRGRRSS